MLCAQFSPLPVNPFVTNSGDATQIGYANLIASESWGLPVDTSLWDAPPTALVDGVNFDSAGFMNVFFIGEEAQWQNSFGIHYDAVSEQYSNSMSTFGQNATIFQGVNSPAPFDAGYYATVPLGGSTTFDLWLSTDPSRGGTRGGIWSLFNPQYNNPNNTSYAQGRATTVTVDGEFYYLVSFEDINTDAGSDHDHDDILIGIQFFREDGTPFGSVPEPSVYGALGVIALLGLIVRRRLTNKKYSSDTLCSSFC